jgi:stringent starvation protein B
MDDSERPSKRDAFLALLRDEWVSLHLDARSPGVVVPAPFSSQAHLVLQYGRNMPIPIVDLEVTDAGLSGTLSFSRIPHRTYVPWSAVYAITSTDGCGILYREDVPSDVALATPDADKTVQLPNDGLAPVPLMQGRVADDRGPNDRIGDAIEAPSPWLRAVPADEEISAEGLAMHLHTRRRRPQLRVVK